MCLEERTGWMDGSNVVVLNESLTPLWLPRGGGMRVGRARPPLAMRSSQSERVVEDLPAAAVAGFHT